jgi:putative phosphoribosyl transferase
MEPMIFRDRKQAGELLARKLTKYANREDVVVLAIPRGGVPVGFEVARALHAPLDVFIVRKLGVPWQEELAFGAVATGGVRVLDEQIMESLQLTPEQIEKVTERENKELERRERVYRGKRAALAVKGKLVLLVDDGIATGSSMLAGITALRQLEPAQIIIAIPVAPPTTCARLRKKADDLVCVSMPESFFAIGQFYENFQPTSDVEVCALVEEASASTARSTV